MHIRPIVIEEAPPIMPNSTATPQDLARFPISPALSAAGGPDEDDELDDEEEWDDDELDEDMDDEDDELDEIENWDEDEEEGQS